MLVSSTEVFPQNLSLSRSTNCTATIFLFYLSSSVHCICYYCIYQNPKWPPLFTGKTKVHRAGKLHNTETKTKKYNPSALNTYKLKALTQPNLY